MTVMRGAEWRLGVGMMVGVGNDGWGGMMVDVGSDGWGFVGRLAYWGCMGYYSVAAVGGFTAVHLH